MARGGQQREFETQSTGSGFIFSADGYIVTNAHVVDESNEVTVRLSDKREFVAKVIGSDKRTDVALLKIDAKDLPRVVIGDPDKLKVGEWVVAIGKPFGLENTMTAGIVSAKGRDLPQENLVPFIQTDVAINPGNSGGPLFNMKGEVIGINSLIYSRTGGYMGLAFAVPIDVAMNAVNAAARQGTRHARPHRRADPGTDEGIGRCVRPEAGQRRARQRRRKGRPVGEGGRRVGRHHPEGRRARRPFLQRAAAHHHGHPAGHEGHADRLAQGGGEGYRRHRGRDEGGRGRPQPRRGGTPAPKEKAKPNRMGLVLSDLTDEQRKELDLKSGGVLIEDVVGVVRGNVQPGDVILAIIQRGAPLEAKSAAQVND